MQAILAEAIEMPGLQKIRTACKKWIKKHDNGRQARKRRDLGVEGGSLTSVRVRR